MLKQYAVEYLKNLYALEVIAGRNFLAAKNDLTHQWNITPSILERLHEAACQEMQHAKLVRAVLEKLGFHHRNMLWGIFEDTAEALDTTLKDFQPCHRAYIRILLNYNLEKKVVEQTNDELLQRLKIVTRALPEARKASELLHYEVMRDELSHTKLDGEVLELYAEIYPELDVEETLKFVRLRTNAFYKTFWSMMRTKQRFVQEVARV